MTKRSRSPHVRGLGVLFACLLLAASLLPRSISAVVVHAHDGHDAHVHLVADAESIASAHRPHHGPWHRDAHAHDEAPAQSPDHAGAPEDQRELVVRVEVEPLPASTRSDVSSSLERVGDVALLPNACTFAALRVVEDRPPERPPPRGGRELLDRIRILRC